MSIRIVSDGSIGKVDQAPRVRLTPGAERFIERASRFEQLAATHPMRDYLLFMGALARAQAVAHAARKAPAIDEALLDQSRRFGMPPLAAVSHARNAQWQDDLSDIVAAVGPKAANALADALGKLQASEATVLESLADRIIAGEASDDDALAAPFIGAALQVYFGRLAATLSVADLDKFDVATVCPSCATRPTASIVRVGGEGGALENVRYLHCALCETEWHMVRVKCTACESTKGIAYWTLSGAQSTEANEDKASRKLPAVRAESCDECNSYLKILYQEKDLYADPFADDLATLTLDVLMDEKNFARSGPNFLFHPGSG